MWFSKVENSKKFSFTFKMNSMVQYFRRWWQFLTKTKINVLVFQANESLKFVSTVTDYANEWLAISSDLRTYLMLDSTKENIKTIRQVRGGINLNGYLLRISLVNKPKIY